MIKQKRKEKAGKWQVPIPKARELWKLLAEVCAVLLKPGESHDRG